MTLLTGNIVAYCVGDKVRTKTSLPFNRIVTIKEFNISTQLFAVETAEGTLEYYSPEELEYIGQDDCTHEWERKLLFNWYYQKCKKCGKEVD